MKRFSVLCLSVLFLWPASGFGGGDETIHKLDEIVVTSTQKATALETPTSLSIITGEELQEMGAKNVVEALGRIPGVTDSSARRRAVVIRGNKSAMAGDAVVLIDGVPQKVGVYQYNEFSFIPIDQIERIEILRSAGIACGPGAARGVINIITRKSRTKGVHGNVSASYGSWDTHDENASLYGMKDKIDFQLNAGNHHTDGYEKEKENRLSFLGRVGYHFPGKSRIGLRVNHMDYDIGSAAGQEKGGWHLENYRREIHFPVSPTDPDLIWHNETDQKNTIMALEFSHKDADKFIDSSLSWTKYDTTFKRLDKLYDDPESVYHEFTGQDTYSAVISGGYRFSFGTVAWTPSFGFNYEDIDNTVDRSYPYNPSKSTAKYNFDLQEKIYGLFWDNDFRFGEKWGLSVGLRRDRAEVDLKDKAANFVDESRNMVSYFLAPSWHFSETGMVYASAGRNYWFPTPRYYGWAVERGSDINPPEDLEPEEALTYELGYKHMLNKAFTVNATVYFADYKDKFGSVYEGKKYRGQGNIGDAEARGAELEVDGRINEYFGYRLAAAVQDVEWTSGTASSYIHPDNTRDREADISGKKVYWVPGFTGLAGLDFYPVERLKISLDMNYTGERYVDYLNQIEYPDKTTFDARIAYTWNQWKFWAIGKNIFDEKLEYVSNSTGRLTGANGEPDNGYYVQDGMYLEFGVRYDF